VQGRSNQSVILLDSTGRTYSLPAHGLPSARGQGEPLTGRINPPSGATFVGALMGEDSACCLLTTDAGYGFVAKLEDLQAKNRAGKVVLSVPEGAQVLAPVRIADPAADWLVAVSNEGRMLVFPVGDLPEMPKGKGNKVFGIPTKKAESREELMVAVAVVAPGQKLVVWCGDRPMTLSFGQLDEFRGERAQRGAMLSRNYRKVDRLEVQ